LVALREPIIGLLYEHGRFTPYDTLRTADVLMGYAVGLYAYASVKVMAPAFYALRSPRLPLYASLLAVACNIAANLALYQRLGAPGLALGTSIGALANFSLLLVVFARRYGGLGGLGLGGQIVRVLVASIAMGAACRILAHWLEAHVGVTGWVRDLTVTLLPVAFGIALYFALASLLRVQETRQAARLVARIGGRLGIGTGRRSGP
jgi:putative peptidoglycan lipid II flippase